MSALLCTGAALAPAPAQAKRLALLVGVGQYAHLSVDAQLGGPEPDVASLKDVLVRRWGFGAADVRTLVNRQATRAAIVAELRALQGRSSPGDEVLVYLSGHGTSALDSGMRLAVPHGSGAFVPADFNPESPDLLSGLIVGRTDLVPVFSALEAAQRRLWVISDSCYSGMQVRSLQTWSDGAMPARTIPLKFAKQAQRQRDDLALAAQAPAPEPYPYRTVAYLAASADVEQARDIAGHFLKTSPTLDGKPHGAFTDALLRVLEGQIPGDLNGDGLLSLNEVHRATTDFMAQRAYGQTPQRLPLVAEDSAGLGNAPVLSMRGVAAPPRQQAPEPLRLAADGLSAPVLQALGGVPDVVLAKPPAAPEFLLREREGRVVVLAASGDLLAGLAANDTSGLVAQVRQLAWAKRIRLLAERHRRAALQLDVDPARGGNFVLGSKIAFVVRPDKPATLVLLNISSDGKVSVLYPQTPGEVRTLPAGQAVFIPGAEAHNRILVTEPLGMDLQFALAFDEPPPGLSKLHHALNLSPDDARLALLEGWLQAMSGKFSFATSSMRALKP